MAKKNTRKCSICRMSGHDKRTCLYRDMAEQDAKQTANKERSVYIRHDEQPAPSAHIVNLKQDPKTPWDEIEVYEEKKPNQPTRRTVDLAEMVRKANAASAATQRVSTVHRESAYRHKIASESVPPVVEERASPMDAPQEQRSKKITIRRPRISFSERIQTLRSAWSPRRLVGVALAALLVVGVPFPAIGYYQKLQTDSVRVVEESTNAFLSLQSSTVAAFQADIDRAASDLNLALQSFESATSIVDQEHKALVYVASLVPFVGKHISGRQHLLSAGQHLALGNTYLVKGASEVEARGDIALTDRLDIFRAHLVGARAQYREALKEISAIDAAAVPAEYQQSFEEFKLLFTALVDDMDNAVELLDMMNTVFGGEQFQRYLILFQNQHELRPTGGFLGSFAVLDVQKGKILNIDVPGGGTYDLKGQLSEHVAPPLPLQLMNDRWEFQDANWFPDFAASAKKAEWFYEHSRGATVDGVIAVNASVLERVLRVLGPVESEDYDIVLDAEDALRTLQYEVEVDYDKEENKPKAVLGTVMGNLLERLDDLDQLQVIGLIRELQAGLGQKEIQVFMHDKVAQRRLEEYGWSGTIAPTAPTQDYLQVVHANLQGQKSDAKISQEIHHRAVVEKDGSIVNTVVIRRTHDGTPGEQFYGVHNTSYVRLYVPEGATLIDAGGFSYPPEEAFNVPEDWYGKDTDLLRIEREDGVHARTGTRVTREFGKTVFGNWTGVAPGETSEVYFTYRLPFRVITPEKTSEQSLVKRLLPSPPPTSRYSLLVQKQSGTNSALSSQVIYPQNWNPEWRTDDAVEFVLNGAVVETRLDRDLVYGVAMERAK